MPTEVEYFWNMARQPEKHTTTLPVLLLPWATLNSTGKPCRFKAWLLPAWGESFVENPVGANPRRSRRSADRKCGTAGASRGGVFLAGEGKRADRRVAGSSRLSAVRRAEAMGRSRSRSPPRRERRRSRSASRERRRRERSRSRERDRRRSRSRSPHRRRSRSPRRHRSSSSSPVRPKERRDDEKKEGKEAKGKERQITEEDLEGKTEEEIEMMKIMGFSTFDTTKGKKVEGSVNAYAINVSQKRKYRQYMNRKGGFNRPLDFIA
uniref:U4/U6.U5 small nuclear ribonucleoprotein 27 kDa protein n=2 Tax=Anolis carolinensis TaxID=28377 RepID=H9GAT4_ANOCA